MGTQFCNSPRNARNLGGFHPDGVPWHLRRFRGDGETALSDAASKHQLTAIYDPDAAVTHLVPRARLTVKYFKRRAYLQGISDSYTNLRGLHLAGNDSECPKSNRRELISNFVKRFFGGIRYAADLIVSQVQASHRKGYRYHQSQFKRDRQVRDWVLRPDYWDYSYPPGSEPMENR